MKRWTQASIQALAEEERRGLSLQDHEPIDPYALAHEYGIKVYPLSALTADAPEAAAFYGSHGSRRWSAALLPAGGGHIIVENDAQPEERRRSNMCHEMGHLLLEHPGQALFSFDEVCYEHQPQLEKDATLLGGFLLVPEAAARKMAFKGLSNEDVASRYGVSLQMAQMRMKGARRYAAHALKKQAAARR